MSILALKNKREIAMVKQKVFKIIFRLFDGLDEFTCGLMCWLQVIEFEYEYNTSHYFWRILDNRPYEDRGQPYD
jgi:hypothetical protein